MTFPSDPLLGVTPEPVHDLGTMGVDDDLLGQMPLAEIQRLWNSGRHMLMAEKRGPAFATGHGGELHFASTGQPSVEEQLVQSLQSQSIAAVGLVLNALSRPRQCFLDVMPAWTRLLKVAGISIPVYRRSPRERWEWDEMREAVVMALCYAEQVDTPTGLQKWAEADALLRGYAMDAYEAIASRLEPTDPNLTMLTVNAAAYKAFAEGK